MTNLLKDLLYNNGNVSLDIARACSFVANIAYWVIVGAAVYRHQQVSFVEVGTGWAAIAAASAAWIYARQTKDTTSAG